MFIELDRISKKYGSKSVLHDVSLTMESGVYGLLGVNGAGKTTLLKILIGLLKPNAGRVIIDGKVLPEGRKLYLRTLSYLPQYVQFYPQFTVWEFMNYMGVLKELSSDIVRDRTDNLLREVNLYDHKNAKISTLSGGMRQRLGIAQAMLNNPKLLVLDEPTSGLDPVERIRFRNLITRFAGERIILLATHIVPDVEAVADHVVILHQGKLIRSDKPERYRASLKGKVWQATVDAPCDAALYDQLLISQAQRVGEKIALRLVSDQSPMTGAIEVIPSLEDAFLYLTRPE